MAEHDQYDPTAYTVDEVNAYLASADDDERARVLQAERDRADGKDPRVGILEGPENPAPADDQAGPETDSDLVKDDANADGVFGTLNEPVEGYEVKPADESAPDDVSTDTADGFVVAQGDDPKAYVHTKGATMADQKAPRLEGEDYRRGYVGELPGGDARPDLTLQGVLPQPETTDED
jgi:hypothetical protein